MHTEVTIKVRDNNYTEVKHQFHVEVESQQFPRNAFIHFIADELTRFADEVNKVESSKVALPPESGPTLNEVIRDIATPHEVNVF